MKDITDIITSEDIKTLVDAFYEKVRKDELLSPIFNERIQNRWPQHLEKMYSFWQTVLLNEQTYSGSPFPPHAQLPINHSHFEKWIELFISTIDELYKGDKSTEAKWRASKMAEMFQNKIEYYRDKGSKQIL
jgi:hemoglobin